MGDFNSMPHSSACYAFRGQGLNYSFKDDLDPVLRNMYHSDNEKMMKVDALYKETQDKLKNVKTKLTSAYSYYNKVDLETVVDKCRSEKTYQYLTEEIDKIGLNKLNDQ